MYLIIGRGGCVYCERARKMAEDKGIRHIYVDITLDPVGLDGLKHVGFTSVPIVHVVEPESKSMFYIGGFNEFRDAVGGLYGAV